MKKFLFLLGLLACFGAKAMDEDDAKQNKESHRWCQSLRTGINKKRVERLPDGGKLYECLNSNRQGEGLYCDENGTVYKREMVPIDGNVFHLMLPAFTVVKE